MPMARVSPGLSSTACLFADGFFRNRRRQALPPIFWPCIDRLKVGTRRRAPGPCEENELDVMRALSRGHAVAAQRDRPDGRRRRSGVTSRTADTSSRAWEYKAAYLIPEYKAAYLIPLRI
jgi:hypothetical protein